MSDVKEVVWDSVDENGNPINPRLATPEEIEEKNKSKGIPIIEESFDKRVIKPEPTKVMVEKLTSSVDGKEIITPVRTTDGLIPWNDPRLKTPPKLWDFKQPLEEAAKLGLLLIKVANKLNGAGLSANQIGIDAKVFAITVVQNYHYAVFNPEILESSENTILMEEGCLSRPGLWLKISRPEKIKVKYFTFKGEEVHTELSGYHSRVFQHEYDHMLGIDFTQRVSKLKLDMALKKLHKQLVKAATTGHLEYDGRMTPIIRYE
jgi:peptide deformylase